MDITPPKNYAELTSVWDTYERLGLALCPWITSSIWGISAPVCLYNKNSTYNSKNSTINVNKKHMDLHFPGTSNPYERPLAGNDNPVHFNIGALYTFHSGSTEDLV